MMMMMMMISIIKKLTEKFTLANRWLALLKNWRRSSLLQIETFLNYNQHALDATCKLELNLNCCYILYLFALGIW